MLKVIEFLFSNFLFQDYLSALNFKSSYYKQKSTWIMSKVLMETDKGQLTIDLFANDAPKTVENFLKLVKEGFYDGLSFHRVINGFMAQGGCPNTREGSRGMPGTGGPGYSIDCEINPNKHQAGSLSMAHAGKNTGGSQFFLVHAPQPHLDGVHTVFGKTDDIKILLSITNGTKINSVSVIKQS